MNDEKKPAVTERPLNGLVKCECGYSPEVSKTKRFFWVECYSASCTARNPTTELVETEKEAIEHWNGGQFLW